MDVYFLEEELLPRAYDWTSRNLLKSVCNALVPRTPLPAPCLGGMLPRTSAFE